MPDNGFKIFARLPWPAQACLIFTALATFLGIAYAVSQPQCGTGTQAPGWSDTVGDAAFACAALGLLFAGAAAIGRHWRVAATGLITNPLVLMIMFFVALNTGLC